MRFLVSEPRWGRRSGLIAVAAAVGLALAACSAHSSTTGAAPSRAPGQGAFSNAPLSSAFFSPSEIASHNPYTGPPADPFSGTPADQWANGAAGIVTPRARPIGVFTATQVEFAYQTTRKLLIAAYLDRRTLLGGPPAAFAALLTNDQRTWFLAGLNKTGVDKNGFPLSTRALIMSFAPGGTQLIGSVIKVHGSMHARAAKDSGANVLDVVSDYIFVYPVEPPGRPPGWMRVVAQGSWTVVFGDWQGAATSFEPSVQFSVSTAGTECGTTDGYARPDYPASTGASGQPSPSGTPVDPYAMGNSGVEGCQATTGT